jgi:mannose-1-phosphate guanylyltransferase
MYAIVLAGGSGTRLWPLSRRRTPKQLLSLTGETSLLQQTIARLLPMFPVHDIYVVTAEAFARQTRQQLPNLLEHNILGEPLARSTLPAAAFGMLLARRDPDEVAVIVPADHYVADHERFVEALRATVGAAQRGYLVTLGVTPVHPATGYGYIGVGDALHPGGPARVVTEFVEKPTAKRAKELVAAGYLWNAGLFAWRGYAFREAIERYQPAISEAIERVGRINRIPGWLTEAREVMEGVPSVSIDIGLAEPAAAEGKMAVVPLQAGWSDIGSWSALLEALSAASGASLVASGEHIDHGSQRVLVHGADRLIVTVGLKDVIIVDTADALLVCSRDRAEEIKAVLDEIAQATGDRYL